MLPALLVTASLVLSPWPGPAPTPASPPVPASAPVSAAALTSPFAITVHAPAPVAIVQRESVEKPGAHATTHSTTSVTKAPEPPYPTIAYARPYPQRGGYTKAQRNMLIAGATLTLASIVPAVFTIRAAVQLARTRDRFFATPQSDGERRFDLQRDGLRQANVVVLAGLATMVLSTTALVLFAVARRKRHRDTPAATPRPCAIDPACVVTSTAHPQLRRAA